MTTQKKVDEIESRIHLLLPESIRLGKVAGYLVRAIATVMAEETGALSEKLKDLELDTDCQELLDSRHK